jgi:hypothetical protein
MAVITPMERMALASRMDRSGMIAAIVRIAHALHARIASPDRKTRSAIPDRKTRTA